MKRDQASSERDRLRRRPAAMASASDSPEPLRGALEASNSAGGGPPARLNKDGDRRAAAEAEGLHPRPKSSARGSGALRAAPEAEGLRPRPKSSARGSGALRAAPEAEGLRPRPKSSARGSGALRAAPEAEGLRPRPRSLARGGGAPRALKNVGPVMRALARAIDGLELPAVEKISEAQEENPFQVLIATLLSARTQDQTTLAASTRLFAAARTPRTMAKLTVKRIERLIYPVSFFRHKARHVKATCQILVDRFGGRVPTTMEELLTLPGVGRKTANLVLILAFKSLRNICVDTHVHRISNRLGWVRTRTPDETEQALYEATAARWWPYINLYLVTWGQNVCRPVYPRCGECVIRSYCLQVGVAPKRREP